MNKVISITEKVPQPVQIPQGTYTGEWCGRMIRVTTKEGRLYELETEEGIRGSCKVVVTVLENGSATFWEIDN